MTKPKPKLQPGDPGYTNLVSQSKACAHLFMSVPAFKRLQDKKVIYTPSGHGYDLEKVREQYILYIRAVASGRAPPSEGALDPIAERARKDKEMADRVALQNAISRGEQAPVKFFYDTLVDMLLRFRGKILPIPTKLAPILEGATRTEIKDHLKKAMDEALNELDVHAFDPERVRESRFSVGEHELPDDDDD